MPKAKKRVLVLFKPKDAAEPAAGTVELGTPAELAKACAPFNTAADGAAPRTVGTRVLYGPGFVLEYAAGHDRLSQLMVSCNEPDIAWPVLSRMCRANGWKMQDAESGQVFG